MKRFRDIIHLIHLVHSGVDTAEAMKPYLDIDLQQHLDWGCEIGLVEKFGHTYKLTGDGIFLLKLLGTPVEPMAHVDIPAELYADIEEAIQSGAFEGGVNDFIASAANSLAAEVRAGGHK